MFLFPFFGAANLHIFFEMNNKSLILRHENSECIRCGQDFAFCHIAGGTLGNIESPVVPGTPPSGVRLDKRGGNTTRPRRGSIDRLQRRPALRTILEVGVPQDNQRTDGQLRLGEDAGGDELLEVARRTVLLVVGRGCMSRIRGIVIGILEVTGLQHQVIGSIIAV